MEFYERTELGGQIDNWCGPSPEGLLAMCRSAGFAQAELRDVTNQRASVVCHRKWPAPAGSLHRASSERRRQQPHPDRKLSTRRKDEYLCCYFQSSEARPDGR